MGLDYLGDSPDIQGNGEGMPMEVDGVKAMVAGVKSHGVSVPAFCFFFFLLSHSILLGQRSTQICEGPPELMPHNPQFLLLGSSICTYDTFHAFHLRRCR